MKEQKIVICSEKKDEIKDKDIVKWLKELNCVVLDVDDEIQENVIHTVKEHPKLITFVKSKSAGSSGDAFLIATAMKYGLAVITEEKKDVPNKIPHVCKTFGVSCMNIDELCTVEGWQF
jgi:predicted nucleic acid-binding protein